MIAAQVYEIIRGEFGADYLVLADGPCDVRCVEGHGMDYVANSNDAFGQGCARFSPLQ